MTLLIPIGPAPIVEPANAPKPLTEPVPLIACCNKKPPGCGWCYFCLERGQRRVEYAKETFERVMAEERERNAARPKKRKARR